MRGSPLRIQRTADGNTDVSSTHANSASWVPAQRPIIPPHAPAVRVPPIFFFLKKKHPHQPHIYMVQHLPSSHLRALRAQRHRGGRHQCAQRVRREHLWGGGGAGHARPPPPLALLLLLLLLATRPAGCVRARMHVVCVCVHEWARVWCVPCVRLQGRWSLSPLPLPPSPTTPTLSSWSLLHPFPPHHPPRRL